LFPKDIMPSFSICSYHSACAELEKYTFSPMAAQPPIISIMAKAQQSILFSMVQPPFFST
jgi:hypothetical protein